MRTGMDESNTIAGHIQDARDVRRRYPDGWEPTWLIEGLIQSQAINLIMGPPKSHKSQLRRYLTACIIGNEAAFGEFPIPEGPQKRVLSLIVEDHVGTEADRINTALTAHAQIALENWDKSPLLLYDTKDQPFNLLSSRCVTDLIEYVRMEEIDVVTIDPFVMYHSADENKANEMSRVMDSLHTIVAKTGAGIILVHHTAKPGEASGQRTIGERARGSSAVPGAIQSAILVERLNRAGFVHKLHFEMKCAEPIQPMRVLFEWETGVWTPDTVDGELSYDDLCKQVEKILQKQKGVRREELLQLLGVRKSYAKAILRDMEAGGRIEVRLGQSNGGRPLHLLYLKEDN